MMAMMVVFTTITTRDCKQFAQAALIKMCIGLSAINANNKKEEKFGARRRYPCRAMNVCG